MEVFKRAYRLSIEIDGKLKRPFKNVHNIALNYRQIVKN